MAVIKRQEAEEREREIANDRKMAEYLEEKRRGTGDREMCPTCKRP